MNNALRSLSLGAAALAAAVTFAPPSRADVRVGVHVGFPVPPLPGFCAPRSFCPPRPAVVYPRPWRYAPAPPVVYYSPAPRRGYFWVGGRWVPPPWHGAVWRDGRWCRGGHWDRDWDRDRDRDRDRDHRYRR